MSILREWATRLDGEVCGGQVLAPGPGHKDQRCDRSLSIKINPSSPDGFLVHSFAGDDFRTCRDYVKQRLGLETSRRREVVSAEQTSRRRDNPRGAAYFELPRRREVLADEPSWRREPLSDARRRGLARACWGESRDPRGTLVEQYLAGRGLCLPDDIAGHALRWHPQLSAVIALFRNIQTGEPQAISRTFLDANGRKLERKFLAPVGGAAVMLDESASVTYGLTIGEGIETCLAARQLDLKPIWALGSKNAIKAFPVLSGIDALTILAEPDAEAEVEACARRWHDAGREVIIVNSTVGKDINDAIRGAA